MSGVGRLGDDVFKKRGTTRVSWWITWTGDDEAQEYAEVGAAMIDNDRCLVHVAIDEIDFALLREKLAWYEQRVLDMLRLGLESAAAGHVA